MISSTRTITTDLRHIDPNPDRIQVNKNNQTRNSKLNSLLLLSTSAEAAVAESKKFETRSRHSSLCTTTTTTTTTTATATSTTAASSSPIPLILPLSLPTTITSTTLNENKNNTLLTKHSSLSSESSCCRSSESPPDHSISLSQSSFQLHNRSNHTLNHRRESNPLFKCEKCLKVYRHPQCLVKHRWEHTEYWADASKLMLSKHQQVQMLEAAAILAAPSGSLPESRSLWPAAVSSSEAGLLGSDRVNLQMIASQRSNDKKNKSRHYHRHSSSASCEISHRSVTLKDVEMVEETESKRYIEKDVEKNIQEEEIDDDEIMFEMSLDGDENTSSNGIPNLTNKLANHSRLSTSSKISNTSVSTPPPIGYFQRRNPQSVSSVISNFENNLNTASSSTSSSMSKNRNFATCLPATVAYQPTRSNTNLNQDPSNHQTVGFAYHSSESIFKPMNPYQDSQLRFETPHRFLSDVNDLKKTDKDLTKKNSNPNLHGDDTEDDEDDDVWLRSVEPEREREGDEVVGMEL